MTTSSIPSRTRVPVLEGAHRVRGLWQRRTAAGRTKYDSQFRQAGRMRRITHPDGLTKTEAIAAHRRLLVETTNVVTLGDRTLTVAALAESFLARERGVLATRKASTVDLYDVRLRKHVLPTMGTLVADDVTVQHVRALIDTLTAQGHSGSSVRGVVTALSAVLRHGERDLGSVRRNVVRDLDHGDRPSDKRRTEPRYLSVQEVEQLLAMTTVETRPVAATLFYAGLRVSEALALRWSDVGTTTLAVRGTKTESSNATVPLLPDLARELRAHRETQAVKGFERIRPDTLVFQTVNGKPLHRRNVLRAVQHAAELAGLNGDGREPVGLHDLRHSTAALAFAAGMTPVEVSRLLRHSDPAVTLTTYAGLDDRAVADLGAKLAAALDR